MKFLRILLLGFLSCVPLVTAEEAHADQSDKLSPDEIVPRFYVLLTQKEKPTEADEKAFFGGSENVGIKTWLDYHALIKSMTPIWDYLRDHKYLFMTQNLPSSDQSILCCSTPYVVKRLIRGKWDELGLSTEIIQKDGTRTHAILKEYRVHVTFPAIRVQGSAYAGETGIDFQLGHECYLDIGATMICDHSYILLEELYKSLRK